MLSRVYEIKLVLEARQSPRLTTCFGVIVLVLDADVDIASCFLLFLGIIFVGLFDLGLFDLGLFDLGFFDFTLSAFVGEGFLGRGGLLALAVVDVEEGTCVHAEIQNMFSHSQKEKKFVFHNPYQSFAPVPHQCFTFINV